MPTDPAEVIGARIRARLAELEMSVPTFAREVGNVSPQAVYRWVRGESLPQIERWRDIATVLGVEWAELFNPEGDD